LRSGHDARRFSAARLKDGFANLGLGLRMRSDQESQLEQPIGFIAICGSAVTELEPGAHSSAGWAHG